jgi:hypothetical protein
MLALCLVGLILAGLFTALGLARKRVPAPLWWLLPALLATVAMASTSVGVQQGLEALPAANLETYGALALSAEGIARSGGALGMLMATLLLSLSALGVALGPGIRTPAPRQRTLSRAAWVVAWCVLSLIAALAWTVTYRLGLPWGVGPALLGGAGMTLLSLRRPEEKIDRRAHQAARAAAAGLWLGATLLLTLAQHEWSVARGIQAMASATPESRLQLFGIATHTAAWSVKANLTLVLMAALACALPVLSGVKALFHKRAVLGAALTAFLLGLPLLSGAVDAYMIHEIQAEAARPTENLDQAMQEHGEPLPSITRASRGTDQWFYQECYITDTEEGWEARAGYQLNLSPNKNCPQKPRRFYGELPKALGSPLVLIEGEQTALRLSYTVWFKEAGEIGVLTGPWPTPEHLRGQPPVIRHSELRRLPLVWVPREGEPPTQNWPAFIVEDDAGTLWWLTRDSKEALGKAGGEDNELQKALAKKLKGLKLPRSRAHTRRDQDLPSDFPGIAFVISTHTTVDHLTRLCSTTLKALEGTGARCGLLQEDAPKWLERNKVTLP